METITARTNPLMTHLRRLASSGSYRRQQGQLLADSPKLLREALQWNAGVQCVVCTGEADLPPLPEQVRLVQVPKDVMASVSPMKTPQGVLFTCPIPPSSLPERLTGRRYVVLDGVQDPGNVGTVLRTLDAFDADGLFLLPGCADPYSPKTIRASMGAVFRRPVWQCGAPELKKLLLQSGIPLYGAALRQDTADAPRFLRPGGHCHRQRGPGPVSGGAVPVRQDHQDSHVSPLRVAECRRRGVGAFVGGIPLMQKREGWIWQD